MLYLLIQVGNTRMYAASADQKRMKRYRGCSTMNDSTYVSTRTNLHIQKLLRNKITLPRSKFKSNFCDSSSTPTQVFFQISLLCTRNTGASECNLILFLCLYSKFSDKVVRVFYQRNFWVRDMIQLAFYLNVRVGPLRQRTTSDQQHYQSFI